jgi:hypothetical protein
LGSAQSAPSSLERASCAAAGSPNGEGWKTGTFEVKHGSASCAEDPTGRISEETAIATAGACSDLCLADLTCIEFTYGRADTAADGSCILYSQPCTASTEDTTKDHYTVSRASKCQFNDWIPAWTANDDHAHCGCGVNDAFFAIGRVDTDGEAVVDPVETVDQCDRSCFEHPECHAFQRRTADGVCSLYKGGCAPVSGGANPNIKVDAASTCYSPSPNVKPVRTSFTCTHTPAINANKELRPGCIDKEEATCGAEANCVWNGDQQSWSRTVIPDCACATDPSPYYIATIRLKDATTSEWKDVSIDGCDKYCTSDNACAEFYMEDIDGKRACLLYQSGCDHSSSSSGRECYTPSAHVTYNSDLMKRQEAAGGAEVPASCGWTSQYNDNRPVREACAAKSQSDCESAAAMDPAQCYWAGYVMTRENCGCGANIDTYKIQPPGEITKSDTTISGIEMKISLSECDRRCFEDEDCQEFTYTDDGAAATANVCTLFKLITVTTTGPTGTTTIQEGCDRVASFPVQNQDCFRPSANEKPSSEGLACTHLPKWNADATARAKCAAAHTQTATTPSAACKATALQPYCVYNPWVHNWSRLPFDDCSCGLDVGHLQILEAGGQVLQPLAGEFTIDQCDARCFAHPDCSEFVHKGTSCKLYRAGCSHAPYAFQNEDERGWSCYIPSVNVKPSQLKQVCTHTAANNANRDIRAICAAKDKDSCPLDSNCYYTPWKHDWQVVSRTGAPAAAGCQCMPGTTASAAYRIKVLQDRAYTADECDTACFTDPECTDFILHDRQSDNASVGSRVDCQLYRPGCTFDTTF